MSKPKRSIRWINLLQNQINVSKFAGTHLVADFWHGKIIEDPKNIKRILRMAVKEAGSYPLEVTVHKFSPQGLTGVVLLAESHIAIHTWPEYNYVAIDVFTCGDKAVPRKAVKCLEKQFKPEKVEIQEIKRGMLL